MNNRRLIACYLLKTGKFSKKEMCVNEAETFYDKIFLCNLKCKRFEVSAK